MPGLEEDGEQGQICNRSVLVVGQWEGGMEWDPRLSPEVDWVSDDEDVDERVEQPYKEGRAWAILGCLVLIDSEEQQVAVLCDELAARARYDSEEDVGVEVNFVAAPWRLHELLNRSLGDGICDRNASDDVPHIGQDWLIVDSHEGIPWAVEHQPVCQRDSTKRSVAHQPSWANSQQNAT